MVFQDRRLIFSEHKFYLWNNIKLWSNKKWQNTKKNEQCFTSLKKYLGGKMHRCLQARTLHFASPNFWDKLICVSLSRYVWKITVNCVCNCLSALRSPNLSFHGVFFFWMQMFIANHAKHLSTRHEWQLLLQTELKKKLYRCFYTLILYTIFHKRYSYLAFTFPFLPNWSYS